MSQFLARLNAGGEIAAGAFTNPENVALSLLNRPRVSAHGPFVFRMRQTYAATQPTWGSTVRFELTGGGGGTDRLQDGVVLIELNNAWWNGRVNPYVGQLGLRMCPRLRLLIGGMVIEETFGRWRAARASLDEIAADSAGFIAMTSASYAIDLSGTVLIPLDFSFVRGGEDLALPLHAITHSEIAIEVDIAPGIECVADASTPAPPNEALSSASIWTREVTLPPALLREERDLWRRPIEVVKEVAVRRPTATTALMTIDLSGIALPMVEMVWVFEPDGPPTIQSKTEPYNFAVAPFSRCRLTLDGITRFDQQKDTFTLIQPFFAAHAVPGPHSALNPIETDYEKVYFWSASSCKREFGTINGGLLDLGRCARPQLDLYFSNTMNGVAGTIRVYLTCFNLLVFERGSGGLVFQ